MVIAYAVKVIKDVNTKDAKFYRDLHVLLHTITIDKQGISSTIPMNRSTPVSNSIRQEEARNHDQLNLSLNDGPSKTPLRNHLQQKLPPRTEHVVDQISTRKQTPSGTQYEI